MKQFTSDSINKLNPGLFWFECAMISACSPVFADCEDNHDVEKRLRKAGVITCKNRTDTEMCALVVNFSTREAGENFIARLNNYLLTFAPILA